ncbi:MAG TPA: hypothetical protein VNQ90_01390 [Chthoniobacteraceae bacterium]|nr:hypothetical protein [Chthoniobacteraceae bacterium]
MKTITLLPQTFFRRGLAALASMLISHTACAAIITPLDQWPNGWTTVKSGGATLVGMAGEKLVMERPDEGNSTGAIAFWDGDATVPGGALGNFSGSVVLSYGGRSSDVWGVLIGAQSKTFTSNASTNNKGFYIGIKANSPAAATNPGGLYIWENFLATSTNPTSGNAVAGGGLWTGTLDANTDFLLEFSVAGAKIEASLWSLDPLTREKGSLLASVTHTHDAAVTGYFGLEAFRFGNPTSRSFSELKLEIIPEPGSAALGAAALLTWLAGYGVFRRRA